MKATQEIQKQIDRELKRENPSASKLANLYDDLADADEGKVRFAVEASHINRLGLELVGRRETALSELIKNAFDADATKVAVTLHDFQTPGGTMEIRDNGVGMTRDVLRSAWMTLSTNSKSGQITSPIFGRPRAGKKGIGRFATQRLGTRLVLETHVEGEATGSRIRFDWDTDYTEGRKLSDIWTDVEDIESDVEYSGTSLFIEDLRDSWTEASLRRVWKSILFLQPPFPVAEAKKKKNNSQFQTDPGFSVEINGSDEGQRTVIASIETDLLQYALANISGYVDEDGVGHFGLKSKVLDEEDSMTFDEKFLLTGKLNFEARYFVFGRGTVPGISVKTAKLLGDEFGGIRIHRNSFRVSPYGEPTNDWLGLDRDVGRRAILPPANNSNFFGHVSINSTDNILLEETSSREGLVENEALEELKRFVRGGIEWAVLRIAAIRGRKQRATQREFPVIERKASQYVQEAFAEFDEIVDEIDADISTESSRERMQSAIVTLRSNVVSSVQESEKLHEEERERNIQYESMLRVLASLGLSISVFGHEIKSATSSSDGLLSVLRLRLKKVLDDVVQSHLVDAVDELQQAVVRVFDLGGYIEDLTSYTGTRKMMPVPVRSAVDRFTKQFSSYLDRYSVDFDTSDIEPKGMRTCEMHSSEFDSVLFNLLTNSMKAFKRENTTEPKIKISAKLQDGLIVLRFEDNGHEISDQHRDKIFDAFYTTTEYIEDDIAGPGTGLGLKIVSDIAESYGGAIELVAPSEGYITCFSLTIQSLSKVSKS